MHQRALEPDGRDRIHRIDRFRDRDSDAGLSQRRDETDELIAKAGHLAADAAGYFGGFPDELLDQIRGGQFSGKRGRLASPQR